MRRAEAGSPPSGALSGSQDYAHNVIGLAAGGLDLMGAGYGFQVAGDLKLNAGGTQFVIVTGAELADQQIRNGLQIWVGSWKYDPTAGIPMLQELAEKNPDSRVLNQIFRDFLLSCGGVASVQTVSCVLVDRELQVSFSLTAEDGSTLTDSLAVEVE